MWDQLNGRMACGQSATQSLASRNRAKPRRRMPPSRPPTHTALLGGVGGSFCTTAWNSCTLRRSSAAAGEKAAAGTPAAAPGSWPANRGSRRALASGGGVAACKLSCPSTGLCSAAAVVVAALTGMSQATGVAGRRAWHRGCKLGAGWLPGIARWQRWQALRRPLLAGCKCGRPNGLADADARGRELCLRLWRNWLRRGRLRRGRLHVSAAVRLTAACLLYRPPLHRIPATQSWLRAWARR